MTWIKPGFLWMMYRCGWALKPNQERVLAIHLRTEWWLATLNKAMLSHGSDPALQPSTEASGRCRNSDVVVQWDPDHDWRGDKLPLRAIQVGLRGQAAEEYAHGVQGPAVTAIEDITDFVQEMRSRLPPTAVAEIQRSAVRPSLRPAASGAASNAAPSDRAAVHDGSSSSAGAPQQEAQEASELHARTAEQQQREQEDREVLDALWVPVERVTDVALGPELKQKLRLDSEAP